MDPFLGQIMMFAGNFAPRGWAFCRGQELNIANYDQLYSVIGNNYGGDGRKTFALPNLCGRVAVGFGHGPGLSNHSLGQQTGSEAVKLSADNLPAHSHAATLKGTSGAATTSDPVSAALASGGRDSEFLQNAELDVSLQEGSVVIASTGNSAPFTNMQPTIALNYVIALQGNYPSRS